MYESGINQEFIQKSTRLDIVEIETQNANQPKSDTVKTFQRIISNVETHLKNRKESVLNTTDPNQNITDKTNTTLPAVNIAETSEPFQKSSDTVFWTRGKWKFLHSMI